MRSLRNMTECCKNHSNPLLETPWVNVDGSSLTGTLQDLSDCWMEPHEPSLAGGALPASPLIFYVLSVSLSNFQCWESDNWFRVIPCSCPEGEKKTKQHPKRRIVSPLIISMWAWTQVHFKFCSSLCVLYCHGCQEVIHVEKKFGLRPCQM